MALRKKRLEVEVDHELIRARLLGEVGPGWRRPSELAEEAEQAAQAALDAEASALAELEDGRARAEALAMESAPLAHPDDAFAPLECEGEIAEPVMFGPVPASPGARIGGGSIVDDADAEGDDAEWPARFRGRALTSPAEVLFTLGEDPTERITEALIADHYQLLSPDSGAGQGRSEWATLRSGGAASEGAASEGAASEGAASGGQNQTPAGFAEHEILSALFGDSLAPAPGLPDQQVSDQIGPVDPETATHLPFEVLFDFLGAGEAQGESDERTPAPPLTRRVRRVAVEADPGAPVPSGAEHSYRLDDELTLEDAVEIARRSLVQAEALDVAESAVPVTGGDLEVGDVEMGDVEVRFDGSPEQAKPTRPRPAAMSLETLSGLGQLLNGPKGRPRRRRSDPALLKAWGLYKLFVDGNRETLALDGVDLQVRSGDLVILSGPPGSGKSTLLHCMAGLMDLDDGQVFLDGVAIHALGTADRDAYRTAASGVVLSTSMLDADVTIGENLLATLTRAGRPDGAQQKVDWTLGYLDVNDVLDRHLGDLSPFERGRVAIARALITEPEMIWADDSVTDLGPEAAADQLTCLARLHKEGLTVVLVGDDALTEDWPARRVHLADGQIISDHSPDPALVR